MSLGLGSGLPAARKPACARSSGPPCMPRQLPGPAATLAQPVPLPADITCMAPRQQGRCAARQAGCSAWRTQPRSGWSRLTPERPRACSGRPPHGGARIITGCKNGRHNTGYARAAALPWCALVCGRTRTQRMEHRRALGPRLRVEAAAGRKAVAQPQGGRRLGEPAPRRVRPDHLSQGAARAVLKGVGGSLYKCVGGHAKDSMPGRAAWLPGTHLTAAREGAACPGRPSELTQAYPPHSQVKHARAT